MIPLKDRNPTRRFPWVTVVLIAANVYVYFFVQVPTHRIEGGDIEFTYEYAAIPCEVTTGEPLSIEEISTGTCSETETPGYFGSKNVYLSVLISMFLHGGLLHIGGNMLFLWIFGNNIEDRLGPLRYLFFYLLGGVVAALAHIAIDPNSTVPVVGASGAIAAVMGAYLIWFPRARVLTGIILIFFIFFREIEARWLLLFWFVLQFFTSPDSGVAWAAHVGGFVFGVVIALWVNASTTARKVAWRSAYSDESLPRGPFGD